MRPFPWLAVAVALAGCASDDAGGEDLQAPGRGDEPDQMGPAIPPLDEPGGLGSGTPANVTQASDERQCVLLQDLTVKCWGDNASGGLGSEPAPDG